MLQSQYALSQPPRHRRITLRFVNSRWLDPGRAISYVDGGRTGTAAGPAQPSVHSAPIPFIRLIRAVALLIAAALAPAVAFAINQTYEGTLVPDTGARTIPIVVELNEVGTFLHGNVTTSSPVVGKGVIDGGGNVGGNCTVYVVLSKTVSLRLRGTCEEKSYTGYYRLRDSQKRTETTGSFRLTSKVAESGKTDIARGTTMTACTRSSSMCLSACPSDDPTAEALCAKLKTCKGQIKKAPAIVE
jgi:hypothetical protein